MFEPAAFCQPSAEPEAKAASDVNMPYGPAETEETEPSGTPNVSIVTKKTLLGFLSRIKLKLVSIEVRLLLPD